MSATVHNRFMGPLHDFLSNDMKSMSVSSRGDKTCIQAIVLLVCCRHDVCEEGALEKVHERKPQNRDKRVRKRPKQLEPNRQGEVARKSRRAESWR